MSTTIIILPPFCFASLRASLAAHAGLDSSPLGLEIRNILSAEPAGDDSHPYTQADSLVTLLRRANAFSVPAEFQEETATKPPLPEGELFSVPATLKMLRVIRKNIAGSLRVPGRPAIGLLLPRAVFRLDCLIGAYTNAVLNMLPEYRDALAPIAENDVLGC